MQPYAFLIMSPRVILKPMRPLCVICVAGIDTQKCLLELQKSYDCIQQCIIIDFSRNDRLCANAARWGRDHMPRKATCAFWQFRCGFAMQLTRYREEEVSRWREGRRRRGRGEEGPHKCQTTSTWHKMEPLPVWFEQNSSRQWGLYFSLWFFSPPNDPPCVSVPQLHTTMDSDTRDMIEGFMESALAQWVCLLSLHRFSLRVGSSFAMKVERMYTVQKPRRSLNKRCYFYSNVLVVWAHF